MLNLSFTMIDMFQSHGNSEAWTTPPRGGDSEIADIMVNSAGLSFSSVALRKDGVSSKSEKQEEAEKKGGVEVDEQVAQRALQQERYLSANARGFLHFADKKDLEQLHEDGEESGGGKRLSKANRARNGEGKRYRAGSRGKRITGEASKSSALNDRLSDESASGTNVQKSVSTDDAEFLGMSSERQTYSSPGASPPFPMSGSPFTGDAVGLCASTEPSLTEREPHLDVDEEHHVVSQAAFERKKSLGSTPFRLLQNIRGGDKEKEKEKEKVRIKEGQRVGHMLSAPVKSKQGKGVLNATESEPSMYVHRSESNDAEVQSARSANRGQWVGQIELPSSARSHHKAAGVATFASSIPVPASQAIELDYALVMSCVVRILERIADFKDLCRYVEHKCILYGFAIYFCLKVSLTGVTRYVKAAADEIRTCQREWGSKMGNSAANTDLDIDEWSVANIALLHVVVPEIIVLSLPKKSKGGDPLKRTTKESQRRQRKAKFARVVARVLIKVANRAYFDTPEMEGYNSLIDEGARYFVEACRRIHTVGADYLLLPARRPGALPQALALLMREEKSVLEQTEEAQCRDMYKELCAAMRQRVQSKERTRAFSSGAHGMVIERGRGGEVPGRGEEAEKTGDTISESRKAAVSALRHEAYLPSGVRGFLDYADIAETGRSEEEKPKPARDAD